MYQRTSTIYLTSTLHVMQAPFAASFLSIKHTGSHASLPFSILYLYKKQPYRATSCTEHIFERQFITALNAQRTRRNQTPISRNRIYNSGLIFLYSEPRKLLSPANGTRPSLLFAMRSIKSTNAFTFLPRADTICVSRASIMTSPAVVLVNAYLTGTCWL